ncbi:MAG: hypothetical protein EOP83_15680 [Verrucomicrobiaceae bacterium]|nr:MAG: hypothetical protein EOP83_15680 [Verrucomicrobiaceae bacterium]
MEVVYVIAGRLTHQYREFCKKRGIDFELNTNVRPPDETTLFCSSGMQRMKPLFSDEDHRGTRANIQTCLRLNDLDEIGDQTHFLLFHMVGLFSFRQMTVPQAIDFWLDFLGEIGLPVDYVTIHPDRLDEWSPFYRGRVPIRPDVECKWSDGSISGYCTEFYREDVEIGNIVNPLGTCIDVGFGLERLDMLLNRTPKPPELDVLWDAITTLIGSGYRPGNKQGDYVLRKLLRLYSRKGGQNQHPYLRDEIARVERSQRLYRRLLPRNLDKSPEWWHDTHGIVVNDLT